ncbi:MAG: hypothetical protein JW723_09995 [Bacteroidales bacterium]|nr:hypothetical protein [Bacteroidales bacterium]
MKGVEIINNFKIYLKDAMNKSLKDLPVIGPELAERLIIAVITKLMS